MEESQDPDKLDDDMLVSREESMSAYREIQRRKSHCSPYNKHKTSDREEESCRSRAISAGPAESGYGDTAERKEYACK